MLKYTSEIDGGKRHVECDTCGAKWHTKWPLGRIYHKCGTDGASIKGVRAAELAELFGQDDPTLIGNKVAALISSIGIPPCGGCDKRREWMNRAHAWLRSKKVTNKCQSY